MCGGLAFLDSMKEPVTKEDTIMEQPKPIRQNILETAANLTNGDRNKSYGEPIDNMEVFAKLVGAYLTCKKETDGGADLRVDEVDAAVIMVLSKIGRIAMNRGHADNYVDGAAYMAIAGEVDVIKNARGDYAS